MGSMVISPSSGRPLAKPSIVTSPVEARLAIDAGAPSSEPARAVTVKRIGALDAVAALGAAHRLA